MCLANPKHAFSEVNLADLSEAQPLGKMLGVASIVHTVPHTWKLFYIQQWPDGGNRSVTQEVHNMHAPQCCVEGHALASPAILLERSTTSKFHNL